MVLTTRTGTRWAQLFSGTPRGARLARLLAVHRLESWGAPPSSEAGGAVALVVAELAANAVTHGCLPGRGFRLRLELPDPGLLFVAVDDPRGERAPAPRGHGGEGSGNGLLLVETLTVAWGWRPRPPSGKTVWAVCPLE
ncbi:ATP-binding protein [Streptomyces sp. UH6]|uniref:ATP-binding protein n=1 Tax=Streptomyces sp. UH6 TaxID=2748379 RepID=UPI0015D49F21|nr:ATP-binding protein [Streptomyces sp. UH6]NYV73987.1 ATP-binding protein [Streptomyces sp. UH6]